MLGKGIVDVLPFDINIGQNTMFEVLGFNQNIVQSLEKTIYRQTIPSLATCRKKTILLTL